MPALVAGIHASKAWMAGTSPIGAELSCGRAATTPSPLVGEGWGGGAGSCGNAMPPLATHPPPPPPPQGGGEVRSSRRRHRVSERCYLSSARPAFFKRPAEPD